MHIRREYIHGPGIDNSVAMITFYDDELVGLYFYHTDALGSVIAMTSVNGVVEEKYRYSPFGRTTIYDRSGNQITRSAIGNPYMFTARRMDEESGLYYYRARMYKPEIGRFLQTDPLGYIDTINPYAYCGNNPLNWIDPWGEASAAADKWELFIELIKNILTTTCPGNEAAGAAEGLCGLTTIANYRNKQTAGMNDIVEDMGHDPDYFPSCYEADPNLVGNPNAKGRLRNRLHGM